jgi:hypothetical protein
MRVLNGFKLYNVLRWLIQSQAHIMLGSWDKWPSSGVYYVLAQNFVLAYLRLKGSYQVEFSQQLLEVLLLRFCETQTHETEI